jgi:hypothetical protein
MSTAKFVHATWSLGFSAWIIWILYTLRQSLLCSALCTVERGIYKCKLAAHIDLRGLRWNASPMQLIFSSEVHVFPEILHVGGWCPYCILKRCWTVISDCNSARHNTHWICPCGVDIVTELVEGHQLAHVCKLGTKKTFRVFLSNNINRICVCQLVSEI